jgi:hypothetical protein
MKTKFALLLACAIISVNRPASAQSGSLDLTFGANRDGKEIMPIVSS